MKNIIIILLILSSLGCETIVDVDVPRSPPKLVINSTLIPTNYISVNLSESKYILDEFNYEYNYNFITDATVDVFEDGVLLETLPYSSLEGSIGYYTSTTHKPIPGKTYKVVASKLGYEDAYAEVLLPLDTVNILNVVVDTVVFNDFGVSTSYMRFNIEFENDLSMDNFYSVSINKEYYSYAYEYGSDPPVIVDSSFVSTLSFIQSKDPLFEEYNNHGDILVFNDELINSSKPTMQVLLQNIEYYNDYFSDGPKKYTVLLSNTSESYYLYNDSRALQNWTRDNPFAEPVQVYSNVINGFGILEAYNTSAFKIK